MALDLILETSEQRPCVDRSSKICTEMALNSSLVAVRRAGRGFYFEWKINFLRPNS
jgi:hypothetical protein